MVRCTSFQSEICAETILDKVTNVWYTIITGKNLVYYITSQEKKLNEKCILTGGKIMRGKRIKQINNWIIRYTEIYQYAVWSPDGRCYEDRLTLEQAENYCRENIDFLKK